MILLKDTKLHKVNKQNFYLSGVGKELRRSLITYKEKTVHLTEWGEAHNPTIVCLHGLGSTSLSFLEVAEELQKNLKICSVTPPYS